MRTAASLFVVYLAGTLLMIASVFLILGGLLLVVGTIGSGWQGRVTGVGLVIAGTAAFAIGRWTTYQYAVQGPHSSDRP